MSYADILDDVFVALVKVGRKELEGSDASSLQQYKGGHEVRGENHKGARRLAYKGDDFDVLKERGFISEYPKILDSKYGLEDLTDLILKRDEDYALLIDSNGVIGLVEEINNYPPLIRDLDVYKFMPDEILCLNKSTKAGSRTKAAARAAVAGCGEIHAFVKKQSGPNPKMVVEFDDRGASRQAYAGSDFKGDIAFYVQEFNYDGKRRIACTPNILDARYTPKKVDEGIPVGANYEPLKLIPEYGINPNASQTSEAFKPLVSAVTVSPNASEAK